MTKNSKDTARTRAEAMRQATDNIEANRRRRQLEDPNLQEMIRRETARRDDDQARKG